jgi:hypothetical protein
MWVLKTKQRTFALPTLWGPFRSYGEAARFGERITKLWADSHKPVEVAEVSYLVSPASIDHLAA